MNCNQWTCDDCIADESFSCSGCGTDVGCTLCGACITAGEDNGCVHDQEARTLAAPKVRAEVEALILTCQCKNKLDSVTKKRKLSSDANSLSPSKCKTKETP